MKSPRHIYIHIHAWILSYLSKESYQPVFFCQCYLFIFWCCFFLANVTAKTLSFFTSWNFSQVDIIKFSIMSSSTSQYSSNFHSFFNKEKTCAETETKIDLISSLWVDDQMLRLDETNRKCLWYTWKSQGISTTKALAHVRGKKGMHIKGCYVPKEKYHITRYQEIQHLKQAWKGVLFGYPEKTKASISSL